MSWELSKMYEDVGEQASDIMRRLRASGLAGSTPYGYGNPQPHEQDVAEALSHLRSAELHFRAAARIVLDEARKEGS